VKSSGMAKHCCESMVSNVENRCDDHKDRFDCPDSLIHYSSYSDTYGLIIHDGGSSVISINYCPWCGTKLREGSNDPDDLHDPE
jgi:hypothetical protein